MKKIRTTKINQVITRAKSLEQLNQTIKSLDLLNSLLQKNLPQPLANLCRVGSINHKQNAAVIFVQNQSALYPIRNFAQIILQDFQRHGFEFDALVTKTLPFKPEPKVEKKTPLSLKQQQSLRKLAQLIGREDLVKPLP